MTLDMSLFGEEYLHENYREIFREFAVSTLKRYGYKVVEKDSGKVKLIKGDVEVWVWPGASELEFCAPILRNQQTGQLEEELSGVMDIEQISCDEHEFYLIGTFSVDMELDDNLAKAIDAVERFLKGASP